jgi:hypothetical protein
MEILSHFVISVLINSRGLSASSSFMNSCFLARTSAIISMRFQFGSHSFHLFLGAGSPSALPLEPVVLRFPRLLPVDALLQTVIGGAPYDNVTGIAMPSIRYNPRSSKFNFFSTFQLTSLSEGLVQVQYQKLAGKENSSRRWKTMTLEQCLPGTTNSLKHRNACFVCAGLLYVQLLRSPDGMGAIEGHTRRTCHSFLSPRNTVPLLSCLR